MKQLAFAFLAVLVLAMFSCKKEYDTITTYDSSTIKNYISANNLTMTAGDSGIYYHVITPGTAGNALTDTDQIFYAFTIKTLDGKFVSTDTVVNRVSNYVGVTSSGLPVGLQFSLKKYLQKRNGVIRLLIPSKQAYGLSGYKSSDGAINIPGNESLDYTVYLYNVKNQFAYDTIQVRNYIKKNNLTGFIKSPTGLYYKIVDPGSGVDAIYSTSTVTLTYTKRLLLTATTVESKTISTTAVSSFPSVGFREGLQYINSGGKLRLLIPSALGYGTLAESTTDGAYNYHVPPNSILDFDVNVTAVTN